MRTFNLERAIQTLIVMLLAVFVYVIFDSFHERLVEVGDSAPDFSITTDNGRAITAASFGGKLLVLNFWATWCPPCVEELPSLNEARARVSFLTARDPDRKISADYGTFKYPESYIIDGKGKVLRKIISNQDWMSDRVIKDVESLL